MKKLAPILLFALMSYSFADPQIEILTHYLHIFVKHKGTFHPNIHNQKQYTDECIHRLFVCLIDALPTQDYTGFFQQRLIKITSLIQSITGLNNDSELQNIITSRIYEYRGIQYYPKNSDSSLLEDMQKILEDEWTEEFGETPEDEMSDIIEELDALLKKGMNSIK